MILTVTLNPSIDISYLVDNFSEGKVNRVNEIVKVPGGKGLNVARILAEMDEGVLTTACIGGKNGEILKELINPKIGTRFYSIKRPTRNCVAIIDNGKKTELLETGPIMDIDELEGFTIHFKIIIKTADIITISGSLPSELPVDYYVELIELANFYGKKVILDCSGDSLKAVLNSDTKPEVLKTNLCEIKKIIGKDANHISVKELLNHRIFQGINLLVVSDNEKHFYAKKDNILYELSANKMKVVSSVGSDDAMVAGIAAGLENDKTEDEILKGALTLSILNSQEKISGHINIENFDSVYQTIQLSKNYL